MSPAFTALRLVDGWGENAEKAYRHAKDWCKLVDLQDAHGRADMNTVVTCLELSAPRGQLSTAADRSLRPPERGHLGQVHCQELQSNLCH